GLNTKDSALLNPLLSGLFGSSVNLGLVGYQGLAAAQVSLLDLVNVSSLNVGTVDELLAANLSLRDLLKAAAVVAQRDNRNDVAVTLNQLALAVDAVDKIKLGDLVGVEAGGASAGQVGLNLLDLVTGGAMLANGSNLVSIPGLHVVVPGINTGFDAKLKVIEAAKKQCGIQGAEARSAQTELDITGKLLDMDLDLGPLGTVRAATGISVQVDLAQAKAVLADIVCGGATASDPEGIDLRLRTELASTISVKASVSISGQAGLDLPLGVLGALIRAVVTLDNVGTVLEAKTAQSPVPAFPVSFRIPNDSYGGIKSYGSGVVLNHVGATALGLTGQAKVKVSILPEFIVPIQGPLISALTSGLTSALNLVVAPVVNNVVDQVTTALVGPLAKLLGLKVAGADVSMERPRPTCGSPRLVG
uniref:hypothetical protein n=1 Tax=Nocardioides jensenii TaxID=1843 RepID=UPI000ACE0F17